MAQYNNGTIITQSQAMEKILRTIEKIAKSDSNVLILGETGVGKELVANKIFELSTSYKAGFYPVNTSALTVTIIESELFGHEKGAFTGAIKDKEGIFEKANLGTLFLDEIGDMPTETQTKLLRVLEDGSFSRVGGTEVKYTKIRVISATNQDLEQMIGEKKFRADLYYRLSVVNLYIPPLKERKEDIPLLITHFLEKYSNDNKREGLSIDNKVIEYLIEQKWSGNIRELNKYVESLIVYSENNTINMSTVGEVNSNKKPRPNKKDSPSGIDAIFPEDIFYQTSNEIKRLQIEYLMKQGLEKTKIADIMGVCRDTIYRNSKKYNLPL